MRISQRSNPGWSRLYARVLRTGVVRPGDVVEVLKRRESGSNPDADQEA